MTSTPIPSPGISASRITAGVPPWSCPASELIFRPFVARCPVQPMPHASGLSTIGDRLLTIDYEGLGSSPTPTHGEDLSDEQPDVQAEVRLVRLLRHADQLADDAHHQGAHRRPGRARAVGP